MDEFTAEVLEMDVANMTQAEHDWLHELKGRAQSIEGWIQLDFREKKRMKILKASWDKHSEYIGAFLWSAAWAGVGMNIILLYGNYPR